MIGRMGLFSAVLLSMAVVMPAQADKLDDIIASGKLRCAVVLDFPPMGSRDEKNQPIGYDVDTCNDLAAALGVKPEYVETPFPDRIPALVSGRPDVGVASASDTLKRAQTIGYSIPYFASKMVVVGIDLSPEMVKWTQLQVQQSSLKNTTIKCMDAEDLEFPKNSFDYVLCGFSLFFFPALGEALEEFRRVLRPGGQLAVSIWGQGDIRWSWIGQVYEKCKPFFISDPNITPTHFHEASILRAKLRQAGFENVKTISDVAEFVYSDADEWWNVQWSHVCRALFESIHPDKLDEFKHEIYQHLAAMQEPNGIHQLFRVKAFKEQFKVYPLALQDGPARHEIHQWLRSVLQHDPFDRLQLL